MSRTSGKKKGDEGEELALGHLRGLGYQIVQTKYRFGRIGEIDIIARDGEYLVFCEVKMRTNDEYGAPEYAITPRKQHQVRKVASGYLFEREIREQACRFDVVAIRSDHGAITLHHIKNAF